MSAFVSNITFHKKKNQCNILRFTVSEYLYEYTYTFTRGAEQTMRVEDIYDTDDVIVPIESFEKSYDKIVANVKIFRYKEGEFERIMRFIRDFYENAPSDTMAGQKRTRIRMDSSAQGRMVTRSMTAKK
jgi:hypothetical protein